jgi:hypothetical protein
MWEKCANPECSELFDYRQGLLCCRSQPDPRGPMAHYWLCGLCAEKYTFRHRLGVGVVVEHRPGTLSGAVDLSKAGAASLPELNARPRICSRSVRPT